MRSSDGGWSSARRAGADAQLGMTHQITNILERLERCELELQASRGYIKALEYGLHAVIASHPAPAALTELWSHLLPEVADAHAGGAAPSPFLMPPSSRHWPACPNTSGCGRPASWRR